MEVCKLCLYDGAITGHINLSRVISVFCYVRIVHVFVHERVLISCALLPRNSSNSPIYKAVPKTMHTPLIPMKFISLINPTLLKVSVKNGRLLVIRTPVVIRNVKTRGTVNNFQ